MISRFFDYNCLVTYMGELDKDAFGSALVAVLGNGPKFIPRIKEDITLSEYKGYKLLKIELIYFIKEGLFSEEDKEKFITDLKNDIEEAINEELKEQSVIFTIEA